MNFNIDDLIFDRNDIKAGLLRVKDTVLDSVVAVDARGAYNYLSSDRAVNVTVMNQQMSEGAIGTRSGTMEGDKVFILPWNVFADGQSQMLIEAMQKCHPLIVSSYGYERGRLYVFLKENEVSSVVTRVRVSEYFNASLAVRRQNYSDRYLFIDIPVSKKRFSEEDIYRYAQEPVTFKFEILESLAAGFEAVSDEEPKHRASTDVSRVMYHHFRGTNTTVCCIALECGHTVVGESHCINDADFDYEYGRELAREDAEKNLMEYRAYEQKKINYDNGDQ